MVVNLLFYSTQGFVYFSVVFFVVATDFADERHDHSETATDASNHNLSFHVITALVGMGLRLLLLEPLRPIRLAFLFHVAIQKRLGHLF